MTGPQIVIRGAREHNLKNIDLDIPRERLVVITGLSGSGKSTLAFDTLYAEGQRRFLESLSAYARQFLGRMERPDVDRIDGLSPVIAIEQKTVSRNPRSTVGTVTEIYDFLRLLFARAATAYSRVSGTQLRRQSPDEIIEALLGYEQGSLVTLLAPVVRARKGHYREMFEHIERQGFTRVRVDGELKSIVPGMQLHRYKTHDIEVLVDRIRITPECRPRLSQGVEVALNLGSGTLIAVQADGEDRVFSRHLYDAATGESYEEPSPNGFSFNSPYGACAECNGLGQSADIDPDEVLPDPGLSIRQGGIAPFGKPRKAWIFGQLRAVARAYGFDFDTPIGKISAEARKAVLYGTGERQFDIIYQYQGRQITYKHRFEGLLAHVRHVHANTNSAKRRRWAEDYMHAVPCEACSGSRLKPEALHYRIAGKNIAELARMDLVSLAGLLRSVRFEGRKRKIAAPILKEIVERLEFMINVGVGYLCLDRVARTLSGGESQRIRLATQIGSQLTGVLYVLDEPSIGLHARDNRQLISSLCRLRDLGNSVLVVEHDREMIESADFVVDLGPGAGEEGGHVVGAAPPAGLPRTNNGFSSLTAAYLMGERQIPLNGSRRTPGNARIVLAGATGHNLKGDALTLPVGLFICVTGVSGSGKSSLINQTLYPILVRHFHRGRARPLSYGSITGLEHVDKVIDIDQKPIGRTPRSNPATYTGLLGLVRDVFARLPESRIRGYQKGRFSFNVKGGRCEACSGAGVVKLEMNFLPDVYVECETCEGRRFNPETLEVRYKGKNISDVLAMTVEEALAFFRQLPRIRRTLDTLHSVGLGYVRLGQPSTTLSGGEAQRVKLSRELARPGTGDTLYILDEPTTGLHFEDIRYLLKVLQALVDKGNTVLIIEHNMDVVKVADYVIDMGPEGGEAGGHILFSGSPEALAQQQSDTARALRKELLRARQGEPFAADAAGLARARQQ